MSSVIGVTAGGIDVASIVSGFMTIERQPVDRLITKQSTVKLQSDAVGRLRNSFDTLKSIAAGLATGGLTKYSSSVSPTGGVLATLGTSPSTGSLSFTVDRLARADGRRTASTVASSSTVITTAASLAVSTTSRAIGLGSAEVGAGVTAGKYTVSVTQATVGAVQTATSTPAGTVAGGTLDLSVDGVGRTLTIAGGTYTASALVDAVQAQIDATGGGATASLDGTGRLKLTTTHEGSAATLQITGGTALADLGFSAGAVATGTDGIVQIGTNPATTVTSAGAGGTISVSAGGGNLTFDVSGGLRSGSATVAVVSTGDRSLAAVAGAINGANVGATASAVKQSEGNWLLQLNSRTTGVNGSLAIDADAFSGLGGLVETSAAQDAQITVGSGLGAYSITSSSNVFSDVMSGVTLTAVTASATPVTVTVGRDDNASAAAVEKFVNQVTSMLADIGVQTKYDPATKRPSPLTADAGVRRLATDIRSAITSMVGDTQLASNVGITVERSGSLKFDKAKFIAAMEADPTAVERLFARGGSATGSTAFAAATESTVAGTYDVNVTTAATRAQAAEIATGSVSGQRLGVRVGSVTATFDVAIGASDADIAAGMNAALASAGLKITAEATGTGVQLSATADGSAGTFETNLDMTGVNTWTSNAGTDVAGTINGRLAVGVGNRLKLSDLGTDPARGLEVTVTAGATGAVGSVTYAPGIAGRIVGLANAASAEGGVLTSSAKTYDSRYEGYTAQIDRYEERLVTRELAYRRQWTAVQSLLNSMQNQQNWLASQVSSLNGGS